MAEPLEERVLTAEMYEKEVISEPDAPALSGIAYEKPAMTEAQAAALDEELFRGGGVSFTPERKKVVWVPGITDMVHIRPPNKPNEQEMEAHRIATGKSAPVPKYAENLQYYEKRVKLGGPYESPLDTAQQAYLAEKREKLRRMRDSPAPEVVRSIGKVMTMLDDFGDSMTTLAWGGKGALWLATKIGLKVASRAVPYLGWALLAKDIVDLVNIFRPLQMLGRAMKRAKWKSDYVNPFGKTAKANRLDKLAKKLPGVPALMEIAQTTDTYLGVGISFGPLVGLATDAIFGTIKQAEWKLVPGYRKTLDEIQATGIYGGSLFNTFGQEFSVGLHMEAAAAVAAGLDTWGWRAANRLDYAVNNGLLDWEIKPKPVTDPTTRTAMLEEDLDPDADEPWPLPGGPAKVRVLDLVKHLQKVVPGNIGHWLKPMNKDFKSLVAGEVLDSIAMGALGKYQGEEPEYTISQSPTQKVYHRLMEGNTPWPEGLTEEEKVKFVDALIGYETQGLPVYEGFRGALLAIGRGLERKA